MLAISDNLRNSEMRRKVDMPKDQITAGEKRLICYLWAVMNKRLSCPEAGSC